MKIINNKRIELVLLVLIIALAAVLRLYKLGTIPSLNADEAALGYNAYSLLKTGHDEHGHSWPLYFESFADYKPALTGYLMMPMIFFFGLNVWSVRIIPSLLGVLTIPVLYFFAKEIAGSLENKFVRKWFPFIAALFLAVSPWQIHFSRGAWEVNIATLFLLLGSLFFIRGSKNTKSLVYSCLFFVLSLYTYHAARIIAPLLVLTLTALYYKTLWSQKRQVISAGIVGIVLIIPLLLSLKGPGGLARAGGVALWSDPGPENRVNELRGDYSNLNSLPAKVLHNKPIAYTLAFLQNWGQHYWGEFLFLSGDSIQRDKVPETGQMYLFDILFVSVGIYILFIKTNKRLAFVGAWLFLAPIPAAITFQSPHALRSESMVIPLTLISALGMSFILYLTTKLKIVQSARTLLISLIFILISLNVARYVHMYYVHMVKEYPFSSQYGVEELVTYLQPIYKNYDHIVVTDRYDQPYILFLFYLKYDPSQFQRDHQLTARDLYGFSTVRSFGNFKFESVPLKEDLAKYPRSLIIGTDSEILPEANIMKDIYGINGYRYFRVVAN